MSLFTLVMLMIASTVTMLTVLVARFLGSRDEEAGQSSVDEISDKQLRFVGIVLGTYLLIAAGLVYGMFWVSSTAPPDYISQKIAKSQDPECLQLRLEKVVESRPLERHDVVEAGKVCNRGTKAGVPIRLQQKAALKSAD